MIEEVKTKEKVKVGRTVLVVDDDVMNLRMIEMTLKRKEYEVIKADSGQAALARLQEKAVDLILLDVEMPGMSGIQTLESIRTGQDRGFHRCRFCFCLLPRIWKRQWKTENMQYRDLLINQFFRKSYMSG